MSYRGTTIHHPPRRRLDTTTTADRATTTGATATAANMTTAPARPPLCARLATARSPPPLTTAPVIRNKMKWARFMRLRHSTNPGKHGPFHYRSPARIFWRTVRGMIPHKTYRGKQAMARMQVRPRVRTPPTYHHHHFFSTLARTLSGIEWCGRGRWRTMEAGRLAGLDRWTGGSAFR